MFKSFRGGIHPKDNKDLSSEIPIEVAPIPAKVVIPLRQHIGAEAVPIVEKGDIVKKGQLIATKQGFVSSNIHASICGEVVDICPYNNGTSGKCLSIIIESNGEDEWAEDTLVTRDYEKLDASELKDIIQTLGVVGMGGATFPTHVKLSPNKKVDIFILNGAECEPYLNADNRVLIEYTDKVIKGTKIAMKILGVTKGYIGIEDNKKEAIEKLKEELLRIENEEKINAEEDEKKHAEKVDIEIVPLPTKYPQGAEKMLIKAITGREVPSGGLPTDVSVVVQNVGTIVAICEAVCSGKPVIERVVTVSGGGVAQPKNLFLKIGTIFEDAISYCGGVKEEYKKVIMGGPMMGFAQYTLDIPVVKGTSGILLLTEKETNMEKQYPCIKCGRCVQACPIGLLPCTLATLSEKDAYLVAREEYSLLDCIECGSCAYSCPAKRKIVQSIRYAKRQCQAQGNKK